MTKSKQKFFGYSRVSSKTQVAGTSLDNQKEKIKKYCELHDFELIKIFVDEGLSAYKERPNFEKMMQTLYENENISGIIVNDLTRFGRSTSELLFLINQMTSKNKTFISIKDNFDIGSKTGKLLLVVLSAIADFERDTIRERMIDGKEWAKIHGTKSGKPMHRPLLIIDWDKVKELRILGLSWVKTAKYLNISAKTLINRTKKEYPVLWLK